MIKFFISVLFICISSIAFGQNTNVIIQINNKLVISEFGSIYIICESCKISKPIQVNYVPGDLILDKNAWAFINDVSNKISLHFDYYTYSKGKQKIANFFVGITLKELKQPYLIINIYDFRDKKYKRWYQADTINKKFLAELIYPNSGVYIRTK